MRQRKKNSLYSPCDDFAARRLPLWIFFYSMREFFFNENENKRQVIFFAIMDFQIRFFLSLFYSEFSTRFHLLEDEIGKILHNCTTWQKKEVPNQIEIKNHSPCYIHESSFITILIYTYIDMSPRQSKKSKTYIFYKYILFSRICWHTSAVRG